MGGINLLIVRRQIVVLSIDLTLQVCELPRSRQRFDSKVGGTFCDVHLDTGGIVEMEMQAGVAHLPLQLRPISPQVTNTCLLIPCLPAQHC